MALHRAFQTHRLTAWLIHQLQQAVASDSPEPRPRRTRIIVTAEDMEMPPGDNEDGLGPTLKQPRELMTDDDAYDLLPPFSAPQRLYRTYRAEGYSPQMALQQTLNVWHEFWHEGTIRPQRRR